MPLRWVTFSKKKKKKEMVPLFVFAAIISIDLASTLMVPDKLMNVMTGDGWVHGGLL